MNFRLANKNDLNEVAELFDAYRIFYKKPSDIDGAKEFISERITNNDSRISA
jgi:hypothetical protein